MTAIAAVADPALRSAPPPSGAAAPAPDEAAAAPDAAARLLAFPAGLPGFPGCRHFRLEQVPGSGLLLLQAAEAAGPSFFLLPLAEDTGLIGAGDRVAACRLLGLEPADCHFLAIATARRGEAGLQLFLNLRAPVVIDARRRVGAQVVLADASYPLRHPVPLAG